MRERRSTGIAPSPFSTVSEEEEEEEFTIDLAVKMSEAGNWQSLNDMTIRVSFLMLGLPFLAFCTASSTKITTVDPGGDGDGDGAVLVLPSGVVLVGSGHSCSAMGIITSVTASRLGEAEESAVTADAKTIGLTTATAVAADGAFDAVAKTMPTTIRTMKVEQSCDNKNEMIVPAASPNEWKMN